MHKGFTKGSKHTEETKAKIGKANRGRKIIFSEEHNEKLSKALKGKRKSSEHIEKIRIAKTKHPDKYCIDCGKKLHNKKAMRCRDCCIKGELNPFYNKKHTQKTKDKIAKKRIGIHTKWSLIKRLNKVRKNYRNDLRKMILGLIEYKRWRFSVFKRNNFICQECFKNKSGYLNAHHNIKSFSQLLSEFLQQYNQFSPLEDKETLVRLAINYAPFWDINNGITLCEDCHEKTETYGKKEMKNGKKKSFRQIASLA